MENKEEKSQEKQIGNIASGNKKYGSFLLFILKKIQKRRERMERLSKLYRQVGSSHDTSSYHGDRYPYK